MAKATDDGAMLRREALGSAIRAARGPRTQATLARALGVPQPSVSRWEQGAYDLHYEQVRQLELELGVALGSLGSAAGYGSTGDPQSCFVRQVWTKDLHAAVQVVEAAALLGMAVDLTGRPVEGPAASVGPLRWMVAASSK